MWKYNYNELYHYGIKGQRWGIRRFQNKDGTLTPAGKRRYDDTTEGKKLKKNLDVAKKARDKANRDYEKAYNKYSYTPTKKNHQAYKDAEIQMRLANAKYRHSKLNYDTGKEAARIKESNIEIKNKSKHRQNLEQKYKELGMTDEQAQAAANKRIRTEKFLAGSAAVAVSACALYVANEQRKRRVDSFIKAGEALQRIEMKDTNGKLHDVFYVAKGKHDMQRYERLLGATRQRQTGKAWMMKLEASKDIKVASRENAAKAFEELLKNDADFARDVSKYMTRNVHGGNMIASKDVSKYSRKEIRKLYENFNTNIVDKSLSNTGIDKKFYDKLKSKGYGAIQDINDMKFSGYNAKNPLIVFDNTNNNIMAKTVEEMKGNLLAGGIKEQVRAQTERQVEGYMKKFGVISAATLTAQTAIVYNSNPNSNHHETIFVEKYLKQHPNTTKSYSEIAKMYKKGA